MKNTLKPFWLFISTALPVSILFILFASSYSVIRTLLTDENKTLWLYYGGVLLFITLIHNGYGIWCRVKKIELNWYYGFILAGSYIAFIYIYAVNSSDILPTNIPRWMLFEGELNIYIYTFLMPAIVYGIFLCAASVTPIDKYFSVSLNIGVIVGIPIFWLIVIQIGSAIFSGDGVMHVFFILLIISTMIFMVSLVRLLFKFVNNFSNASIVTRIVTKLLFLLILPFLCFVVNNFEFSGIIGDFSHYGFYIFAITNGLALAIPPFNNRIGRALLMFLRSALYPIVVYFFFVLLPFFPLSIVAIIALGFGFLMLTPIIVMFFSTQIIAQDFRTITKEYSPAVSTLILVLGLLIAPASVFIKFHIDKSNLHKALAFVYEPDLISEKTTDINIITLNKTLNSIKSNKDNWRTWNMKRKPYLSPFYEWYVLDNMTLSETKLKQLDRLFSDTTTASTRPRGFTRPNNNARDTVTPKISSIEVESKVEDDYTSTWVHLNIEGGKWNSQEYVTSFTIPEGCWISDYYLDIEGRREYGILSEKKSATWVYQQITTVTRKDPGILFYTEGQNKLALRVFPFRAKEMRTTGFKLIHKEDVTFNIDNKFVKAPTLVEPSPEPITFEEGYALSAAFKESLPLFERKPEYDLIVDCSKSTKEKNDSYIQRIESFIRKHTKDGKEINITFANYKTKTISSKSDWKTTLKEFPREGGFFLERALKKKLIQSAIHPSGNVPLFIVLTDDFPEALFIESFNNWESTFPDVPYFYKLNHQGDLNVYSYFNPYYADTTVNTILPIPLVRVWSNARAHEIFIANNDQMTILPALTEIPENDQNTNSKWNKGLSLHLKETALSLNPVDLDNRWLELVKESLKSRILSLHTSFLSLENESQKAALSKKQKQVLSTKKALDIGEEKEMSEPGFWMMLFIAFGIVFVLKRRGVVWRT